MNRCGYDDWIDPDGAPARREMAENADPMVAMQCLTAGPCDNADGPGEGVVQLNLRGGVRIRYGLVW